MKASAQCRIREREIKRERESRDRETDRETDRQTDRQTNRERERDRDKQRQRDRDEREREGHRERKRGRERYITYICTYIEREKNKNQMLACLEWCLVGRYWKGRVRECPLLCRVDEHDTYVTMMCVASYTWVPSSKETLWKWLASYVYTTDMPSLEP